MQNPEDYEACMAQESAEKRVIAKCDEIRQEFAASERNIRAILESVKRQGFAPTK